MSGDAGSGQANPPSARAAPGWRQVLVRVEDLGLSVALGGMMLLPVAEIILRLLFKTGISGSSTIVQHLTLIVGMLGGAIAAREGRLLALSPAQTLLKGRAKSAARIVSSACAAVTGFCLAVASY